MTVHSVIPVIPVRRRAAWTRSFLMSGLLVATLSACGGKEEAAPASAPALTVELVSPVQQTLQDAVVASGEVAPWQEAIIGAEVPGVRLEEVLVNVGDTVKKGQLLARFNEDAMRAELERLKASVAEAAANLEKAQADVVRADRLQASDTMSGQMAQSYRTQAKVAEAQLASAQAQRSAQALRLSYARVVAPDDGVISSRTATAGAVSMAGAELFRLVRRNRLEWRAQIPGEVMRRLKAGDQALVQTLDGVQISGQLRQLSPTVDAGTRTGLAYVDLPQDSGLSAGMFVTGRFILGASDGLVVPESAIVLRDGNRYLMKIDGEQRIRELKVATGRRQNELIEVLSGITPADRFVKSGGAFLSEGSLVRVATPAAAQP